MATGLLAVLAACGDGETPAPAGQASPQQQEATGEGTVVFEEDFEADSGPFQTGESPGGLVQVDGGRLNVNIVSGFLFSVAELDQITQILRIEADVSYFTQDVAAFVGCRTEAGDEYRFMVGPGSKAAIYRVTAADEVSQLGTGEVPLVDVAGGARLRAECLGQGSGLPTRLILYGNDEVVVDAEDPEGLGDITSLVAGGERYGDEPGQVYFDNVRVTSY